MNAKNQSLEIVTERIERLRSAKDMEMLSSMQLRLMGYLEALDDQGLISNKEAEELNRAADKVNDERAAQIVANGRQK